MPPPEACVTPAPSTVMNAVQIVSPPRLKGSIA